MPEGPECRRVYEGLRNHCINKKLVKVEILGGRFIKTPPSGLETLGLPLEVVGGGVKGKFIWLELEEGMSIWITLGMSGFWSIYEKPHSHIKLVFDDGLELFFVDQRRFGTLKFATKVDLDAKLKTLGVNAETPPDKTAGTFAFYLRQQVESWGVALTDDIKKQIGFYAESFQDNYEKMIKPNMGFEEKK